MLLVETYIGHSAIHGLGCYARQAIAKGQLVWVYDERIDRRIREADVPALPPSIQAFLGVYGYTELFDGERVIVLCGDHSRHMNHADDPNLASTETGDNYAARDIAPGEELTCNYYEFDLDAGLKLGRA